MWGCLVIIPAEFLLYFSKAGIWKNKRLCARLERMASLDGKCHDPWAQVDSQSQVHHTDILLSIYSRLQQVLAQPQGSLWAPSGEGTDPPPPAGQEERLLEHSAVGRGPPWPYSQYHPAGFELP